MGLTLKFKYQFRHVGALRYRYVDLKNLQILTKVLTFIHRQNDTPILTKDTILNEEFPTYPIQHLNAEAFSDRKPEKLKNGIFREF